MNLRKTFQREILLGGLAAFFFLWPARLLAQDLQWPATYHDEVNTNRSQGTANILEPVVRWSLPVGLRLNAGQFWQGDLDGGETHDMVFAAGGKAVRVRGDGQILWISEDLGITRIIGAWDFDGNGRRELLATSENAPPSIIILHDQTGALLWRFIYQSVAAGTFDGSTMLVDDLNNDGLPEIMGKPQSYSDYCYVFSFVQGYLANPSDNILWYFAPTYYKRGLPIVSGDVDNDGRVDVVVQELHYLHVLEGATGVLKHRFDTLGLNNQVKRGMVQIENVDDDPQAEIVHFSDSPSSGEYHVAVLDAVDQSMTWQFRFPDINGKDLIFAENSVADLNGDGSLEIVVSLYNDTDDETGVLGTEAGDHDGLNVPNRWVLIVFDAATGNVLAHRTDAVLESVTDLTGDGLPELLVRQETAGSMVLSSFAPLQSLSFTGTGFVENWTLTDTSLPLLLSKQVPGRNPMIKALTPQLFTHYADGVPRLLVLADDNGDKQADSLVVLRPDGNTPIREQVRAIAENETINLWGIGYDLSGASQEWELAVFSSTGKMLLLNPRLGLESSIQQGSYQASMIAADLAGEGTTELLVAGGDNSLMIIDATDAGPTNAPSLRLQSYFSASPLLTVSPPWADGARRIPVRVGTDPINPAVTLLDEQGAEEWSVTLSGYAFPPLAFRSGHFNNDAVPDLLVATLDLTQDSANDFRLIALNGGDGTTLWNVPGVLNGVVSGNGLFLRDINADDVDDVILLGYSAVEVYDGTNGSLLSSFGNVYYTLWSIFQDMDEDLIPELLVANHSIATGFRMLDLWPTPMVSWTVPHTILQEFVSHGALFRLQDAWAVLRVGEGGFLDGLRSNGTLVTPSRLYPRNGLLETVDPGTTSVLTASAVGDIDDDGQDEALVGSSDGYLYAINLDDFSLLWSLSTGSPVGRVILADTDADGALEILISTVDGMIHLVDEADLPGSSEVRDVAVNAEGAILDAQTDIDTQEIPGYLGAAWEPVPGADGYRAAVLDINLSVLIPYADLGNVTQTVWPMQLVLGKTYFVAVVPYDSDGKAGPVSTSDGITFLDTQAPEIRSFTLSTDRFSPAVTSLGIEAELYDQAGLERYKLLIRDASSRIVHQENKIRRAQNVEVQTFWDGVDDESGQFVEDGLYDLTLYAEDGAGAVVSQILSVTVDLTAPATPSITVPQNEAELDTRRPEFAGTGEADSLVVIYTVDSSLELCRTTTDELGNWTCASSVDLPSGSVDVHAVAQDDLGNESDPSTTVSLIIIVEEPDGDEIDGDETDGDVADGDETDGDETDGDETDGDEIDGDETDGDEIDGDETDGDETDGDEIDGDETDGDVTDGDVTDGDVTDGDVTDGDVTDGDETDGDETDGDETDGDETDGDETDGDETDGDETDGDETDGDETDGDETDGDVTDGDETDGDETDGDFLISDDDGGCGSCQSSQSTPTLWGFLFLALWGMRRRLWLRD